MPSQTFFNLPEPKREALIKIAIEEFSTHDYDTASISRVVRETGIAKGSFYQYFQDKKDLYVYLLSLLSEAKLDYLQQTPMLKAEMDCYEYLTWLFNVNLNFDKTHPVLSRLAYRAFYGNSSFTDPEIAEIKQASSKFIHQIVIRGIESGDIKPDIDPDLAVFVVDTLVNAFNHYIPQKVGTTPDTLAAEGSSSLDDESAKETFDELMQIIKFGLLGQENNYQK